MESELGGSLGQIAIACASGIPLRELPQMLGMDIAQINAALSNPRVQQEIAKLRKNLNAAEGATFDNIGEESIEVLRTVMNDVSTPASVRANIAMNFLDRKFGKPVQRSENFHTEGSVRDLIEALAAEREAESKPLLVSDDRKN